MQYPLTEEELIEDSWPISLTSEGNEDLAERNDVQVAMGRTQVP